MFLLALIKQSTRDTSTQSISLQRITASVNDVGQLELSSRRLPRVNSFTICNHRGLVMGGK